MKSNDGTLKKYSFVEVNEVKKNDDLEMKVNQLDNKLNRLLKALGEEKENEPTTSNATTRNQSQSNSTDGF